MKGSKSSLGMPWCMSSQTRQLPSTTPPPPSPSPPPAVSIYNMKDNKSSVRGVTLLHTMTNKQCTSLHWSPSGRFLLLAGLGVRCSSMACCGCFKARNLAAAARIATAPAVPELLSFSAYRTATTACPSSGSRTAAYICSCDT